MKYIQSTSRWFAATLVAMVAIVAITDIASRREFMRPLAVTRVDNLEVVTQAQWTDASGPTVTSGAGDPNGAVTQPIGSLRFDTTTPALWQNQDGATAWSPIGSGVNGSIGTTSIDFTAWSSLNITTVGTADWASWEVALQTLDATLFSSRQMMPPTASTRAARLWYAPSARCAGTTGCNSVSMGSTATPTGNGRSTTIGANNAAAAAQSNTVNMILFNPTSTGYGYEITLPLLPGEAGTLFIYGKVVDSVHDYQVDMINDGVVVDTDTGVITSSGNATVDYTITIPFSAGTTASRTLRFFTTCTARGATNPRLYLAAAALQ